MNLQDRIVDTLKRHVYDTVPETETTREYSKICTEEIVLAAKAILALVESREPIYAMSPGTFPGDTDKTVNPLGDGSVPCCDNGDMDEKHKCLKQPPTVSERPPEQKKAILDHAKPLIEANRRLVEAHEASERCCELCYHDIENGVVFAIHQCEDCPCHSPSSGVEPSTNLFQYRVQDTPTLDNDFVEPTAPVGWERELDQWFLDEAVLTKEKFKKLFNKTIKNREREIAEGLRSFVERVRLDVNVTVCDCGERYKDSDLDLSVGELEAELALINKQ